jgi:hypothetical protein
MKKSDCIRGTNVTVGNINAVYQKLNKQLKGMKGHVVRVSKNGEVIVFVHDLKVELPFAPTELKAEVYYQPEDTKEEIFSFEVYRSMKNAQKDFPGQKIIRYSGDDIEDVSYID